MPGETRNGMQCVEFEVLLSDALDQALPAAKLESFQSHARVCPACGPLFAEADAGRRWLKELGEVEPPARLVRNILAATTGREVSPAAVRIQPRVSWTDRVRGWVWPVAAPVLATVRQPRFAMSFGMAFFSLSLGLSVAGVKVGDLRRVDLRPSAIRRTYYETQGRVVKYYENIRFVYEIESRVREFKRSTTPAEPGPVEKNKNRKEDNTSGQPEPRQERNYTRDERPPVLASAPDDPPVVTVTTNRRLV